MKTSESLDKIAPALVAAHKEIAHAKKDSNNPHFRNDYASLESVIDATKHVLLSHGIVMMQGMNSDAGALETRLLHVSGQFIETGLKLVLSKQDMQGLGSAITYARRYEGAAVNNISQQDDDGNASTGRPAPQQVKKISKTGAHTGTGSSDDF